MSSEGVPPVARLVVRVSGEEGERTLDLGATADIGRGGDCAVVVSHPSVSRRHAEITHGENGVYAVRDLGSMNGTFVNGMRVVGARELYHGDVVFVGECRLTFVQPDAAERPEADPELFARLASPSADTLSTMHKATLAVLACDVRGYASLAEKLPANELQDFVAAWARDAVAAAVGCGGLQDSATQDTVLVYWLIRRPETPADEVNAALEACRRILACSREYAEEFSGQFSFGQFEASIALHLGEASVASVGTGGTAIVGDAVSIALALAELPRDGGQPVVASWSLAQWAAPEFRFRNLGPVALRGRDDRVPALLLEA